MLKMPLTRFEECFPLPVESLPELPKNLNIVILSLTLWPINCGVLTSLLLQHLSSSLTNSLPSLNLLCHSKADGRFIHDGRKAVWSIPYVSVASFFPSLKQNFIAYRSCKVSSRPDCIFEIHQLWQSGFSRVYSNCCCSCSFEPEIIKIGQSSHKMYSNNILNFQESTIILNACTKVWKLIECATYIYIYIYIYISSRCTASRDIPDPLSPPFHIIHCFRLVFRVTSRIGTELLYVGSRLLSCLCSSMWRGSQEYSTYELVPTSPAMSPMSCSSNFDSFLDGRYVAVQLLLCGVLPPWLLQYRS